MMSEEKGIVEFQNIVKTYAKQTEPAVKNLNLQIPEYALYGFLGPNGAGKTTTIRMLAGLLTPSSGTILFRGQKLAKNHLSFKKHIGYLPQHPCFYPWMTGREVLELAVGLFGITGKKQKTKAQELLELADLHHTGKKRIGSYSGGMVQRLGIAQALAGEPQLLILDEPAASLDPIGRKDVLEFIAQLKGKTTVFMSSHILEDVERICDTIAVIRDGTLLAAESLQSMRQKYSAPVICFWFESAADAEAFCKEHSDLPFAEKDSAINTQVMLPKEVFFQKRSALLHSIAAKNLALLSIAETTIALEDLFLRIVGGEHAAVL